MAAQLKSEWGHPTVVLQFSNPGRANGVNPDLMRDLVDLISRANEDAEVRAIVLTGEGRFFCAGADLIEMAERMASAGLEDLIRYMGSEWMPAVQRGAWAIRNARPVMIAAINGPATAGGLDLALNCDYVVSVPDAKLGESYVKLGLLPVAGGAYLLNRRLPTGIARRLLLSGETVLAEYGALHGLVDEVCDPDQLLSHALGIAGEMASSSAETLAEYKKAFQIGTEYYRSHLEHALQSNRSLLESSALQDDLRKLLEGREVTSDRTGQRE